MAYGCEVYGSTGKLKLNVSARMYRLVQEVTYNRSLTGNNDDINRKFIHTLPAKNVGEEYYWEILVVRSVGSISTMFQYYNSTTQTLTFVAASNSNPCTISVTFKIYVM